MIRVVHKLRLCSIDFICTSILRMCREMQLTQSQIQLLCVLNQLKLLSHPFVNLLQIKIIQRQKGENCTCNSQDIFTGMTLDALWTKTLCPSHQRQNDQASSALHSITENCIQQVIMCLGRNIIAQRYQIQNNNNPTLPSRIIIWWCKCL